MTKFRVSKWELRTHLSHWLDDFAPLPDFITLEGEPEAKSECCEKCLKCPDYDKHNYCHDASCPCHQPKTTGESSLLAYIRGYLHAATLSDGEIDEIFAALRPSKEEKIEPLYYDSASSRRRPTTRRRTSAADCGSWRTRVSWRCDTKRTTPITATGRQGLRRSSSAKQSNGLKRYRKRRAH
jgi:hypothetical protein